MRALFPLVLALAGAGCGVDPDDSATTRGEPPRPFATDAAKEPEPDSRTPEAQASPSQEAAAGK